MLDALSPLGGIGNGIADGKGAIYLWAKLPIGKHVSLALRRHPSQNPLGGLLASLASGCTYNYTEPCGSTKVIMDYGTALCGHPTARNQASRGHVVFTCNLPFAPERHGKMTKRRQRGRALHKVSVIPSYMEQPSFVMPSVHTGCEDDEAVVAWLVRAHKVCVIPGSSCGAPGHIRAAFANLPPDATKAAAASLKAGLQQLVAEGPAALQQTGVGLQHPSRHWAQH